MSSLRLASLAEVLLTKLYWWHSLAHFVAALLTGIIIANYLFRGFSWDCLIMSKDRASLTGRGTMRHNLFEWYLATIFFITLFVWSGLNSCTIRFLEGFQ